VPTLGATISGKSRVESSEFKRISSFFSSSGVKSLEVSAMCRYFLAESGKNNIAEN